jgi:small subunit ribosomal protein S3Ae
MPEQQQITRKKMAKGKIWYKLLAPALFNKIEIGETVATEPEALKNRIVIAQYSVVSGDVTKSQTKLRLRVTNVEGEHVNTEIIGYEISKVAPQRFVRRRASKMDEVVDMKIKDKFVRLKAVAITLRKANSSQRTAIRKIIKSEVLRNLRDFTFEQLIIELASGKPQRMIQKRLKLIYPIKFMEIRKLEILPDKKIHAGIEKQKIEEVIRIKEPEEAPEEEAPAAPKHEHSHEHPKETIIETAA